MASCPQCQRLVGYVMQGPADKTPEIGMEASCCAVLPDSNVAWAIEQRKDPELQVVIDWVGAGRRPAWEEVMALGPVVAHVLLEDRGAEHAAPDEGSGVHLGQSGLGAPEDRKMSCDQRSTGERHCNGGRRTIQDVEKTGSRLRPREALRVPQRFVDFTFPRGRENLRRGQFGDDTVYSLI
ncbi:hypothetical protein DPX16_0093 [Anabarilius grahami]|uniref:Uncharacterized protein n=1 Tax=Anabarilius grahami TaxID=495550 RepID=A0A3N0YJ02_ANAGA|nr:hypothetical protein DPX16_0093 [Anabarilius grahami]